MIDAQHLLSKRNDQGARSRRTDPPNRDSHGNWTSCMTGLS